MQLLLKITHNFFTAEKYRFSLLEYYLLDRFRNVWLDNRLLFQSFTVGIKFIQKGIILGYFFML